MIDQIRLALSHQERHHGFYCQLRALYKSKNMSFVWLRHGIEPQTSRYVARIRRRTSATWPVPKPVERVGWLNPGRIDSLPCALLIVEQARRELETIRRKTSRPINVNFFCHRAARALPARLDLEERTRTTSVWERQTRHGSTLSFRT